MLSQTCLDRFPVSLERSNWVGETDSDMPCGANNLCSACGQTFHLGVKLSKLSISAMDIGHSELEGSTAGATIPVTRVSMEVEGG